MRKAASLQDRSAQPVKEAIDDRLQTALAGRFHPHPHGLAEFLRPVGGGGTAHRKVAQARVPDAGVLEWREVVVTDAAIVQERCNRLLRFHLRQARDLLRCAAKTGALEEMASAVKAPVGGSNRGEVIGPARGACPMADEVGAKAFHQRDSLGEIGHACFPFPSG